MLEVGYWLWTFFKMLKVCFTCPAKQLGDEFFTFRSPESLKMYCHSLYSYRHILRFLWDLKAYNTSTRHIITHKQPIKEMLQYYNHTLVHKPFWKRIHRIVSYRKSFLLYEKRIASYEKRIVLCEKPTAPYKMCM